MVLWGRINTGKLVVDVVLVVDVALVVVALVVEVVLVAVGY